MNFSIFTNTSPMALSSTLRFSSSFFLFHNHCRHARFLSSPRRFLSFPPSRPPPSSRTPILASKDEERNGNGSVATVGPNVSPRIVPVELHEEMTGSYITYSMSVLLGRALPDVRDGLKPVHRRILFAMHELGLSSRKPFKKCARVVGEVLGKFHPHGDNAVYDSLVRMAQDFSLRYPLIRGHGNFGSIDADPAAAMRYTECRLEALSEAMLLADIDQDTVNFVPNFDESQKEPSLLPARLPTLLLNGASGIAVGMATNIPPHNLGELVDVLCALIHNPEATLQELLEYMPGPDFPTGGLIMGNLGILDAYRTGRGRITVRGKTEVELLDSKSKRMGVIIKEIPYQTNKSMLVEKIAELVENKTLDGISDIRDESDRSGMRIVIELKRGADPSIVVNSLYRLTALQSSFSCNMVGILDGQPKQMGLKEVLQAFLDFRCSVVERRARFKLSQVKERRHIVEGIMVGLDNLDRVIRIVREAPSNSTASAALKDEFKLSEKQADAILDMNLRRLTMLERKKFVDESKTLMEQILKLEELLSSRKNILQLIEQEAIELKNRFSTPRLSMLEDADSGQLDDIDIIPNDEMLLAISEKGYVKRMKPNTFNLQNRGTIGKSVGKLRVNDAMSDFIVCRAHDHVLYFSDRGIVYSARAYKIPECTRNAAGTPLVQILSLSDGERITSIIPVSEFAGDQFLVMLTMNGYIKKVSLNLFSSIRTTGIIAIQLVPGDELKWVRCCTNDDLVAMASQNGMVILSSCDIIRSLSRNTRGSVAMRLKDGDKMASMDIIPAALHKDLERTPEDSHSNVKGSSGPWLLFVSESGHGKRVPLSSFRKLPLNRVGLIGYKFSAEDRLAAVFVVGFSLAEDGESDEQVVLVSQSGTVNRIKVRDISIQARYARGVILMRLELSGKIQSASLISVTEPETDLFLPSTPSDKLATESGVSEMLQ
ncbi:DNA gyrase subunit A [Citrus sinensis]|uniref:DNA gyrase subunit A, chloroplastic/mitochondrial n=1 Tax=Citrus clementina TaxID=85681 RepID=UPI0003D73170|nr:DNA gyrase subunit A, chloroplastic/mitochondrial isoform X1 [Citrus sinensis]XP_024046544.1 DNA gyrase subunit A, chloroplastic/mitochondrial [Citrus x clementina]KAH9704859.1 DNA gyrase subunit A [Citrus sinensis]